MFTNIFSEIKDREDELRKTQNLKIFKRNYEELFREIYGQNAITQEEQILKNVKEFLEDFQQMEWRLNQELKGIKDVDSKKGQEQFNNSVEHYALKGLQNSKKLQSNIDDIKEYFQVKFQERKKD